MSSLNQKYPRAGIGIMILKDNQVLLGKRHDDPEKASSELHGEGTWTMPGGKLDFGEEPVEAIKRETFEECGIKVKSLRVVSLTNDFVGDAHFITIGFLGEDFEGEPEIKEPDEIVEWRWFPLDQLPEPMYPSSAKLLRNYLNKKIYEGEN